jgi:hypothetical protein
MSRSRNAYRRAGSWVTGTGWVTTTAPAPEPVDTTPPPRAINELRHGYTLANLDQLTRLAVGRCGPMASDYCDRRDIVWSAIAEALYSATTPPHPSDLIRAGQRALWDSVTANLRHDGYAGHQVGSGPGSGRAFQVFWAEHAVPTPSPEGRIVEHLALAQIMPLLTPRQRDVITALAAHGDYQVAADAIGLTRNAFVAIASDARSRFRAWWHEGEAPSGHWRRDIRRSSTGAVVKKSGLREQLKQHRCKTRAKNLRAGLITPKPPPEPVSDATRAAVVVAYLGGGTIRSCAALVGLTEWQVRVVLNGAGVVMRPRGQRPADPSSPRRMFGDLRADRDAERHRP